MANIHSFPSRFFAEQPLAPAHTSPSAEDAAMTRPRYGLHLVGEAAETVEQPWSAPETSPQIGMVVARIDVEVARQVARDRLRRLFPEVPVWPLGAA